VNPLRLVRRCAVLAAAVAAFAAAPASAAGFSVTSSFAEGAAIGSDYAGSGDCGGKNVSPPLTWSNAPAATKSIAILATDLDGRNAMGVVHWIAYSIAPTVTSIPAGFGSTPNNPAYVGGPNNRNLTTWLGLCPAVGDAPHHYVFTVYALDLAPGALATGLTRDAFLAAIAGHSLAGAVLVGHFSR